MPLKIFLRSLGSSKSPHLLVSSLEILYYVTYFEKQNSLLFTKKELGADA